MFADRVNLNDWRKCAEGSQRAIYENRAVPRVLIKIVKETERGPDGARKPKKKLYRFKEKRRFGAYLTFRREVDEFLEQARKLFAREAPPSFPVARIFGLVQTSRGLGLAVERISTSDGQLAPTLLQLIRSGQLQRSHLDLIDRFFERCAADHIVLMDCNPSNFVVTDRRGFDEIICVDGTGDKSWTRIYSASPLVNQWKLRRYRTKLLHKMNVASARLGVPSAVSVMITAAMKLP